ncbi:GDSL-type esterase/lipase family protein [Belliella kenyensis]|uniref:GDSL-type esterase/lipase family protein n=1 Tax=Belliella kenyensis TaxID=1472724 RepID=A0ABV8EHF7_9BACT|nr:GDSL-type esterase/lipase family protein [Belliella kenyensis]MCH7401136.1 GDSL-type esterase/lipase family protein [Belliella kenyensis]MDN3604133.1 GDSL-type esterase/lipase family protein [Belliella kenyensis]
MKIHITSLVLLLLTSFTVLAQQQVKVACVGNSITQGPGRDHPDSYPLQLQELLGKDYLVKNFGVSGRTLLKNGDFPYWNEPQFEEVKAFFPEILIIKLGTNDSKPQNWKFKDEFKNDYIALVNTIKESMPENGRVYICIPVPVAKDNWGINEKVMVEDIKPLLLEIAVSTQANLIDLHTPLSMHPELLPDGVHPNKEGLGIMAKTIASEISNHATKE